VRRRGARVRAGRRNTLGLRDTCGNVAGCFRTVRRRAHRAVDDCRVVERLACRPCCAGTSRSGCPWTHGAVLPEEALGSAQLEGNLGLGRQLLLEGVAWYDLSFYGQITRMEPNDPFPGYMPPPLDGIWATAPYFHNGSVPTIELVLKSSARPTYWKRVDLDSTHFDEDALGWPFESLASPADVPAAEQSLVYDTTQWSQSNAGHPFGDHLTERERRGVLEYLKTL
jgi:hypothetical protein